MKYPKFSVLMSLYINEKVDYFDQCMKSLLNQTVLPSEIVIVFDGPLTHEMYQIVDNYCKDYPNLIKIINNNTNKGLGLALADGVPACSYELIARMDTDDISREDRFEKLLEQFIKNPNLDICGSSIAEFEVDPTKIVAVRNVPTNHSDIINYQKTRDAFNHVSVMFKKQKVIESGNYQDCPLMEDTLLWVHMIQNGALCSNISDQLVFVRIGEDMYERRGGIDYFKKYRTGRKRILDTGYISYKEYFYSVFVQLIVCLLPNSIRGLVFKKILHK